MSILPRIVGGLERRTNTFGTDSGSFSTDSGSVGSESSWSTRRPFGTDSTQTASK